MGIRGVLKEACATAVGIVLASFVMSYAINLGKVVPAFADLPSWTVIVALLSIGGRVLGALAGVSGAMLASVVSPEVARYARGAARAAYDELSSWVGHLLGMTLSVVMSYVLRYVAFLAMSH